MIFGSRWILSEGKLSRFFHYPYFNGHQVKFTGLKGLALGYIVDESSLFLYCIQFPTLKDPQSLSSLLCQVYVEWWQNEAIP